MNAAYILKTGPADAIVYGPLPDPEPAPDQVLVRMLAVTVDSVDTFVRSGAYPIELTFPFILGRDMVGTVIGLGAGVTRFRIGDSVWCNNQGYSGRQGTFAELLTVDEDLLYLLPAGVEATTGVSLLHALLTACVGLLGKAELRGGETLFLHGGSGSVGSAALQMAKRMGCRVAVTAGSETSASWCRELGADCVVRYDQESLSEALGTFAPEGVNVYWDMTPAADLELAAAHTARRGRILLSSGLTRIAPFPVGLFYTRNLSIHGFTVTDLTGDELAVWAETIRASLPGMRSRVARVLGLDQAAQAHQMVEVGERGGKVVLVPTT